MTVFVVEADPREEVHLGQALRSAGHAVEIFSGPRAFLADVGADRPGCVLADLGMAEMSGLEFQRHCGRSHPLLPFVLAAGPGDVVGSVQAMKNGAVDVLVKPMDPGQLLAAVALALAHTAQALVVYQERAAARERLGLLTPREREVCMGVVRGHLNKQIAAAFGTAEQTVRLQRSRMMEKLGVSSVAALVRLLRQADMEPV